LEKKETEKKTNSVSERNQLPDLANVDFAFMSSDAHNQQLVAKRWLIPSVGKLGTRLYAVGHELCCALFINSIKFGFMLALKRQPYGRT
jgi:hypothetical protein